MAPRVRDLTSLLTAAGVAMGRANGSLVFNNVPTILNQFTVTVNLSGQFSVPDTLDTLQVTDTTSSSSAQMMPATGTSQQQPTLSISATYIAAPSLVPVPPT